MFSFFILPMYIYYLGVYCDFLLTLYLYVNCINEHQEENLCQRRKFLLMKLP